MFSVKKVSDIAVTDIADYLRLDAQTATEQNTLQNMLTVSKAFIQGYTGLTPEQIDEYEDFVIVVFVLCQDMYDNRTLYVDNNNLNNVVDTILGMHRVNLL